MHRHHVSRYVAETDNQPDSGSSGSAKVSGEYQEKRDTHA